MKIDERLITRISELARLDLKEEEKKEFLPQISDILNYVEKINELDTDSIKPADHIVDLKNVTRSDTVENSMERADLEKMAPQFYDGHIVVPKIIEGGE